LLIFEVTERRIHPLPNQKSKLPAAMPDRAAPFSSVAIATTAFTNRKSSIHGRSAAEKTNRVAVHRAKIRRDSEICRIKKAASRGGRPLS